MKTVRHLLDAKGRAIYAVPPDASVYRAIELMAEKGIGALLVVEGEKLVGIVSERDYARKVILQGRKSTDTPVRDIMTSKVIYVSEDRTAEECMALMTERRVRHLPVMEQGVLVGMISIGDVVRGVISEKEFLIQQLEKYISGG